MVVDFFFREYFAKKSSLLCLFFFLLCFSVKANFYTDSLKKVAVKQTDSVLVDTYVSLFKYYYKKDHNTDSMLKFAQLAYKTAESYKLNGRQLRAKRGIVLSFMEFKKNELAKEHLTEGLNLAKKFNNTNEIIEMNNLFGFIYGKENKLDKSAFYYLNSAKEFEKLNDYANLAFTYKNVIVIFTLLDQFPKIIFYTQKSLDLIPKINQKNNSEIVADIYSSAAQHYFYVAEKSNNKKSLIDSALIFADSCLKVASRYGVKEGLSDAYYIFAYDQLKKREFDISEINFFKALEDKRNLPERTVFNIYSGIVTLNLEKLNYNKAKLYLDSCKLLPASKELDGPLLVSELEYKFYKKTKDFEKALIAYENLTSQSKSNFELKRNKVINDLETKYQTELKEEKIAKLNQQQEINTLQIRSLLSFIAVAVLAIVVIVFFYRQSVARNRLKTIETEQRLNRARMDPHFFFNILSSLRAFTLKEKDVVKTADYLTKYSKIMRQSLESSYNELITVETELDFLNNYIEIQKLRYPGRFKYTINIHNENELMELLIPSMIIQPFVENAIEHGFKDLNQLGEIVLDFEIINGHLKISISDNGVGIQNNNKSEKAYPSRATQIVKDRLFLLNKQHKSNARFEFVEKSQFAVSVNIFLPVIS